MDVVKVNANLGLTCGEILKKATSAQVKVTEAAFRDCTKYCKKDTGRLMESGQTEPSSGIMTWNTEYARRAYYTGAPDKSKNPYASLMWAHKAAEVNRERWKAIVEKELL